MRKFRALFDFITWNILLKVNYFQLKIILNYFEIF